MTAKLYRRHRFDEAILEALQNYGLACARADADERSCKGPMSVAERDRRRSVAARSLSAEVDALENLRTMLAEEFS